MKTPLLPLAKRSRLVTILVCLFCANAFAASERDYTVFESGQVRPLALNDAGSQLVATNTPNNSIEIYNVTDDGLSHRISIPVGLEPIAVAINENNAWVVNHLSDSISIVDLTPGSERVVRTLLVGDEPRDIVFAGHKQQHAYVTTAHRGQNIPFDPQLTTPGVGRADVWVFDPDNLGSTMSGDPVTIINLFTDTPRALAVSKDGKTVYAAGFKTGNQTTSLWESVVTRNGGLPEPRLDSVGELQPNTGIIVKYDGQNWLDNVGREWNDFVRLSLPDKDVFVIDATAQPPQQISGDRGYYQGVGTVLFNMIVNPTNGNVYVSNTEAFNDERFEGLGASHDFGTVRGRTVANRITILRNGKVEPRELNKHIDPDKCCDPIPNSVNDRSLAQPLEMAISSDGESLFVAAFGSGKVGIFDTKELEKDTFVPDDKNHIELSAGGPTGLVLDDRRKRLYVLTRFDNGVSIVNVRQKHETAHVTMHNPEPPSVVEGRRFLYDASYTSSNGNSSCASCHIFGDVDDLAWDLGDPDGLSFPIPGPFMNTPTRIGRPDIPTTFRTLKGPMTTQSLRGMANHGPMHWRGDRTAGNEEETAQPDSGTFNEVSAFKKFNPAFVGLVGRHEPLTSDEMQAFTDFVLQIMYPPNPIRNLDNSLTAEQQAGKDRFFGPRNDTFFSCGDCHTLDPDGNAEFGVAKPGFFGSRGFYNAGRIIPQMVKVPHLRNLYQKIGMFGFAQTPELIPYVIDGEANPFMGDQVRGFGFNHDGSNDTIFTFHLRKAFLFREAGTNGPRDPGNPGGFSLNVEQGHAERRQVEAYLLAFESNLAPVVGQQITLGKNGAPETHQRINLLLNRSSAGECEVVAHKSGGRGYLYIGNGVFRANNNTLVDDLDLRDQASNEGEEITYTCAPSGSGERLALDRDEDGIPDRQPSI